MVFSEHLQQISAAWDVQTQIEGLDDKFHGVEANAYCSYSVDFGETIDISPCTKTHS